MFAAFFGANDCSFFIFMLFALMIVIKWFAKNNPAITDAAKKAATQKSISWLEKLFK